MKQNLVLKYFSEICKIPNVSGNEQGIANYVSNILKQNGSQVTIDKLGNVYATKAGSLKVPGICLQAHLDMVGEKTLDSTHNFATDPIDFYEDGGWIKARGTTLGADNGVGIALILALFTDQTAAHGPLEAIFTVQEETTTIGAIKLKGGLIKSPYLLNVDSEDDNQIAIGSGGSCDFIGTVKITRAPRTEHTTDLVVKIFNGNGGHSGLQIHGNTINCIVESFNILKTLSAKFPIRLISMKTTGQLNAIPNHAEITINIPHQQVNLFKRNYLQHFNQLKFAYIDNEKNLSLIINNIKSSSAPLTIEDSNKVINLVAAANNGLNNYDDRFRIPRISTNLGSLIIRANDVQFGWLQRSDSQYDLNKLNNKLIALFTLIGGSHKIANIASGLKADINNRLALQIQHISQHKFNHPVTLSPIHAVLEMGEIAKNYPNIVAASLGVNIKNPHTPKEMVEIKSILYTYELLKEVAKSIK